jgi:acyl-Coa thioesterase superfamily protein/acyl-CoA thioesterase superfamily protein
MTAPGTSLFDRSVAVTSRGDGAYDAWILAEWTGPAAPNGGILAATMLRAAEAELGPGAPPARTVAAHYFEAPAPGPAQLQVEVLRRGKRVSACEVRLSQDERLASSATFLFSASRDQAATLRRAPLDAPPDPASVPELDFRRLPGAPPVFKALELRPTLGAPPFTGAGEAITGGWMALRDDDAPLDPARLCALADLWWPAVFSMIDARAAVPTIQLTVYLRSVARAVRPPVFARFETRVIAEAHLEESGELWSAGGELLVESRQLALLPAPR